MNDEQWGRESDREEAIPGVREGGKNSETNRRPPKEECTLNMCSLHPPRGILGILERVCVCVLHMCVHVPVGTHKSVRVSVSCLPQ